MRKRNKFNTPRNYLKKDRLNEIVYLHSLNVNKIVDKAIKRCLENANISEAK